MSDITEEVTTEPEVTAEDIAKMFSGYQSPAIVEETKTEENESSESAEQISNVSNEPQRDSTISNDAPYGKFANGKPRKRPARNSTTNDLKDREEAKIDAGIMIDGAMFLMMVNMLIPLILSSVNNYFSKTKVKPEAIEMTEKQESKFAPLVDRCLRGIEMKGNPQSLLMFGLLTIFGVNFINARMEAEISTL